MLMLISVYVRKNLERIKGTQKPIVLISTYLLEFY